MKMKTIATVAVAALLVPAAAGAKPTPTSITLHGRWTITVRDRSGHVVATRRFENSLTGLGQVKLIALMWGVSVAPSAGAGWGIVWQHQELNGPAKTFEPVPVTKRIHIDNGGFNENPQNLSNITLLGSVKAAAASKLIAVGTSLRTCGGSSTADACPAPATPISQATFTYKALDSPLSVAAGQTIDFTVVLYFS